MKINFTGGLIKCKNTYINPNNITKFERKGYYTDVYLKDKPDAVRFELDASKFADVFIKTQTVDKKGKFNVVDITQDVSNN